MLYRAYLFHSALRNNLPLVVYYLCTLEEYRYTENDVKNLLEEIVNLLKRRLDENLKESPDLNFDDLRKLFMMLGLAMVIIRVLEKHRIFKGIKEGAYLSDIERLFTQEENSIYRYFELTTNTMYLQQEIQKNFLDNEKLITNEWKLLEDITNQSSTSINPRNFLAHCGFEKNITEVKKSDNGGIIIRYTSYYKEPAEEKGKENEYNSLEEIFKEKIVKGVLLRYGEMD
jgi:CRISPR-associated protein Csx1